MKSIISWVGGKSKMVKRILPMIEKHKTYVEVFAGAGWVLFGKDPDISKLEVLNDFDGDLINFYDVVKNHPKELINSFSYTLVSRKVFDRYKEKYRHGLYKDNIERAHIFYYLVKSSFASRMLNPSFGTGKGKLNGLKIHKMKEDIEKAYERLKKVTIENKSFEDIMRIYDGEETVFFLDPPYRKCARYAVGTFSDEKYQLLAKCCKNLKGRFILTMNDDKFIRETFKGFNITEEPVTYSVSKNKSKKVKELIITNY